MRSYAKANEHMLQQTARVQIDLAERHAAKHLALELEKQRNEEENRAAALVEAEGMFERTLSFSRLLLTFIRIFGFSSV